MGPEDKKNSRVSTLCFFHKYFIPSIKSLNIAFGLEELDVFLDPVKGVFIGRSDRKTAKYNRASIVKFQKNPNEVTSNPPTKGPIIRVPGIVSTLVVKALLKESEDTVFAIKACLTGIFTDSQHPATKA